MKQKYTIGFIALVLTIVLAGCVHAYPSMTEDGEEGIDPTLVEVNTEVTLDLELVPLEIITQKNARSGTTKAGDGYRRRFIIEAWREGKPIARQVTVMDDAEEDGDGRITLPIRLKLHAVEYTLAVWTDYVAAGTTVRHRRFATCRLHRTLHGKHRLPGLSLRNRRPRPAAIPRPVERQSTGQRRYGAPAGEIRDYRYGRKGVFGEDRQAACRRSSLRNYRPLRFLFPAGLQRADRKTRAFGNGRGVYRAAHRCGRRQRGVYARFGLHLCER